VPALTCSDDFSADSVDDLVRSVKADQAPDVEVRVQVVDGLAARVLLERCEGADMLVLGTASDTPGAGRPLGPVIRACLRRAICPVVVISTAQDPGQHREGPVKVPAGVGIPAAAGV
jgi:nucleotide-binding universal stress UspA family protein